MNPKRLARTAHQTLDEVVGRGNRRREDDDVLIVRLRKVIFEFVDQQNVVYLQRRFHRTRRDEEGTHDERDQEERDEAGDDERVEIFFNDDGKRRRCNRWTRAHGHRPQRHHEPDDGQNADEAEEFEWGHACARTAFFSLMRAALPTLSDK